MVEEMRFAALLPKVTHYNPEAVNARTTLQMATINGAKAIGMDDITGSLEPGKKSRPDFHTRRCLQYDSHIR